MNPIAELSAKKYLLSNGYSLVIASTTFGKIAALFKEDTILWAGSVETLRETVATVAREKLN